MASHSQLSVTENYTSLLETRIEGRMQDQARMFDPATSSPTNLINNAIRWSSASNKWQKWNGTTWLDLTSTFAISISGNSATATKLANARTIGGVSFDGTANIDLPGVNTAGNQNTTGNAATVTNGVYTVGNQIIAGVKTFSSTIQGSVSGTAGALGGLLPASYAKSLTSDNTDVNNLVNSGMYRLDTNPNLPPHMNYSQMLVIHGAGDTITQLVGTYGQGDLYTRSGNPPSVGGSGSWSPWRQVAVLDPAGKLILSAANQGIQFADGTTQTTAINPAVVAFCTQNNANFSNHSDFAVADLPVATVNLGGGLSGNTFTAPRTGILKITIGNWYWFNASGVVGSVMLRARVGTTWMNPEYGSLVQNESNSANFIFTVSQGQQINIGFRIANTGATAGVVYRGVSFEMLT